MPQDPGWVDFPLHASTHSGSTYLLNMLVEVGISIFRGSFEAFWRPGADAQSWVLHGAEQVDLGVWFPKFQTQTEHRFASRVRVRWGHHFPRPSEWGGRLILVVRHPHDFLWSYYQRAGLGLSFAQFLRRPAIPELQGVFSLYPADEWALFNALFRRLVPPERLCLVRFEDLKSRPAEEFRRVLDFLGERRSAAEISAAVEASAFDRVREAATGWYERHPVLKQGEWRAMRKGQVGEAGQAAPAAELTRIEGPMNRVAAEFGYLPEREASRPLVNASDGLILACRAWTELAFAGEGLEQEPARRMEAVLLDLLRESADRALLQIAAARGLARAQRKAESRSLLEACGAEKDLAILEKLELGAAMLEVGATRDGTRLLEEVADEAPPLDLQIVGRRALRSGEWTLSRRLWNISGRGDWMRMAGLKASREIRDKLERVFRSLSRRDGRSRPS